MKRLLFVLCLTFGTIGLWATNDTIDLADAAYGIEEVETYYYESGGQAYYSFSIYSGTNYDFELRLEAKVSSKEHIQGTQVLDLDFCFIDLDDVTEYTFTKAFFWLKYTGKNVDGDPLYDFVVIADASDGKVYKYKGNLPVFAFDRMNGNDLIDLEDVVDDSVVDPSIDQGGATAVDQINNEQPIVNKVLIDGQLYILRNGEIYSATGARVE